MNYKSDFWKLPPQNALCMYFPAYKRNYTKRAFPAKIICLKCSLFLMLFCRLFCRINSVLPSTRHCSLPFAALLLRCVSAAALLILLAASTRTRIVRIYLCRSTLLRRVRRRLILVRSGHFRYLLTLNLLLNLHMIQ